MSKQNRLEKHINAIITNGKLSDVAVLHSRKREGLTYLNVGLYWNCNEADEAVIVGSRKQANIMLTSSQMRLYITTKNEHVRKRAIDEALSIFEDVGA